MSIQTSQTFFEYRAACLNFKGEKTAQLLHGQLSNAILTLKVGEGAFNLLLNQKGKVRGEVFVFRTLEAFVILCDPDQKDLFWEHFSRLAPLSRVVMRDDSALFRYFHFIIPSPDELRSCLPESALIFQTDRLGLAGSDVLVRAEEADPFVATVKNQGFHLLKEDHLEYLRVSQGISKRGADYFYEEHLPQECRLDRALHFSKGCYLGQEIIARLHFKGHVNKILQRLALTDGSDFRAGQKLIREGKDVGVLTSVVQNDGEYLALGYVPYKLNEAGALFQIESGGSARII